MRYEKWGLYLGENERIDGVAIVHQASDYALEFKPNGLSERDRHEWCERLCKVLNDAWRRGEL